MNRQFQNADDLLAMQYLGSAMKGYTVGNPVYLFATNIALTNQQIRFTPVYLPNPGMITGVKLLIQTTGSYTSSGYNGVGIYGIDSTTGLLTLLASSTTSTTIWAGAPGLITVPFSALVNLAVGVYYISFIYQRSAEVTAPQLWMMGTSASAALYDFPNSIRLYGVLNGANTVFPATQASSGIQANGNFPYCFIY